VYLNSCVAVTNKILLDKLPYVLDTPAIPVN